MRFVLSIVCALTLVLSFAATAVQAQEKKSPTAGESASPGASAPTAPAIQSPATPPADASGSAMPRDEQKPEVTKERLTAPTDKDDSAKEKK